MKALGVAVLSLILVGHLFAQTAFEKSYPVEINNEFNYISQLMLLPDSSYIFSTTAYDHSNNFILVGRLDKHGATIWVKQIDDNHQLSQANFAFSSTGFLFLTYSAINRTPARYFSVVLKMDTTGNLIWSKSYGDTTRNEFCEHIFLTSSSIYLAGETRNTVQFSPSDLYLLKLDTAGNFLWGKTYDAGGIDYLRDAKQLGNNDILLSGWTIDSANHNFASLFRVDTNGGIVWHSRFHLPSYKEFNAQAVNEDYDGSLLVSGHADTVEVSSTTYFGKWDISLMKLSSTGNFIWGKIYGGSDFDEDWEILPTSDHGYILAAEPESFGNVSRISLMKTDSVGNIDWMRLYGNSSGGFPDNIVINHDNGYSILATDGSYNVNAPMIFIRTDSLGHTICNDSLVTLPQKSFVPISDTIGGFGTLSGIAPLVPVILNYPLTPSDYCDTSQHCNLSAVILIANQTTFCSGDIAYMCAPTGYISYIWSTGQSSRCIYTQLAGNYYVTVTDNSGCTAESNHLAISVYPLPPVAISVNGDTLSVYGAVTQQWYLNGGAINNATAPVYIAQQGGSYTVAVTDTNGCLATSSAVIISGIDNMSEEDVVSVAQMAVNGWQLTVGNNWLGSVAEIFDVNGRVVFKSEIRNPKSEIATNVAKGVYLLRISSAKSSVVRKLIKL